MSEGVSVELIDHQQEVLIPAIWLHELRDAAQMVWALLPEWAEEGNVLGYVESLDIAFVSAAESDRIHREFMCIDGATDVITFLHGELIICPTVAKIQAAEHAEPLLRELLRYIVHGMLHLAGHLDDQEKLRITMERAQEEIVTLLWTESRFRVFGEENAIFLSK